jgi:hypothetical protein
MDTEVLAQRLARSLDGVECCIAPREPVQGAGKFQLQVVPGRVLAYECLEHLHGVTGSSSGDLRGGETLDSLKSKLFERRRQFRQA